MPRGRLRIYLGAAPGVGKTFAMVNEGWRRHQRGSADIVVGYVEAHGRPQTEAQIRDLEVIARRRVEYRGTQLEEMDVDAILARRPDVVLVDELAHTNAPGSRNEKRWQDVEEFLAAGIEVISTLNVQHLDSMNDVIRQITGIEQRETIPDAVVRTADQIELVDMSPEALRRRMAHGNVYQPDKVDAALANYFRVGNLSALRELALLWVADRVDEALEQYRDVHHIDEPWETRERVVVAITGAPQGDHVIRRAARLAARAKAELLGVHVRATDGLAGPSADALAAHRELVRRLGGEYHEIASGDVSNALVRFARLENATQIVLGASRRARWVEWLRGSVVNAVVRQSGSIDVHVISHDAPHGGLDLALPSRGRSPVAPRRRMVAWGIAIVGPPLLTLLLAQLRESLALPSNLLLYLLLVVIVAAVGGFLPALLAAVASFLLANWYFAPPHYTFTIAENNNLLALVVFLVIAAIVGFVVSLAARRTSEAARARAEAETLAAMTGTASVDEDPLPELLDQLRRALVAAGVAVVHTDSNGAWDIEAETGVVTNEPVGNHLRVDLGGDRALVVSEPGVVEDPEILHAFGSQVAVALERRRLRQLADEAGGLAQANELRTALLAAVSHDLRTPLASIKASVTSLLLSDVDFAPDAHRMLLETIDEESDRLNALVGNLLDMSRLQTGALELLIRDVGFDEVVPAALAGLGDRAALVDVDVPETLPRVRADAALLERVVANLVSNAVQWSPDDARVRVEAALVGDHVCLRVIDRGPGIPIRDRERVFLPFQRLGDTGYGTGVGLGLAVARGFVEAMGGELVLDDTPGGGLTMEIDLAVAT